MVRAIHIDPGWSSEDLKGAEHKGFDASTTVCSLSVCQLPHEHHHMSVSYRFVQAPISVFSSMSLSQGPCLLLLFLRVRVELCEKVFDECVLLNDLPVEPFFLEKTPEHRDLLLGIKLHLEWRMVEERAKERLANNSGRSNLKRWQPFDPSGHYSHC